MIIRCRWINQLRGRQFSKRIFPLQLIVEYEMAWPSINFTQCHSYGFSHNSSLSIKRRRSSVRMIFSHIGYLIVSKMFLAALLSKMLLAHALLLYLPPIVFATGKSKTDRIRGWAQW